jgi:predicted alpha/beta hydrolase family esterase
MNAKQSIRVLIVPGLHGSPEDHWQSWLTRQYRLCTRVEVSDWSTPDLLAWSTAIHHAIDQHPDTIWIAVAHSFGCLGLTHHLHNRQARHRPGLNGIAAALMVAPASPLKFALESLVVDKALGIPCSLIASENDPWLSLQEARTLSKHWCCDLINKGKVGHINVASGFGPWPWIRQKTDTLIREQLTVQRVSAQAPENAPCT